MKWGNYQTCLSEQVSGCEGVQKQRREKQRGEHMDVSSLAVTVSHAGEGHNSLKHSKCDASVRQTIGIIH